MNEEDLNIWTAALIVQVDLKISYLDYCTMLQFDTDFKKKSSKWKIAKECARLKERKL